MNRKPIAFLIGATLLTSAIVTAQVVASEPVPSSRIINQLVPITGEEEGRSIDLDITFRLGSAALSPSAKAQLDALGEALMAPQLATAQIGIYGHTDASGGAALNQKLSEQRAASVRIYLVETFGIDPDRLFAAGYGEDKLKNAENPTAAENRRVQIVNLTPMPSQEVPNPAREAMPRTETSPAPPPVDGGGMQSIQ